MSSESPNPTGFTSATARPQRFRLARKKRGARVRMDPSSREKVCAPMVRSHQFFRFKEEGEMAAVPVGQKPTPAREGGVSHRFQDTATGSAHPGN